MFLGVDVYGVVNVMYSLHISSNLVFLTDKYNYPSLARSLPFSVNPDKRFQSDRSALFRK